VWRRQFPQELALFGELVDELRHELVAVRWIGDFATVGRPAIPGLRVEFDEHAIDYSLNNLFSKDFAAERAEHSLIDAFDRKDEAVAAD